MRRWLLLLRWWGLQAAGYEVERRLAAICRLHGRWAVLWRVWAPVPPRLLLAGWLGGSGRVEALRILLLRWEMLLALRCERLLWRVAVRGGRALGWIALWRRSLLWSSVRGLVLGWVHWL